MNKDVISQWSFNNAIVIPSRFACYLEVLTRERASTKFLSLHGSSDFGGNTITSLQKTGDPRH